MNVYQIYAADFPIGHKIEDENIIAIHRQERWDELNAIVVCKDRNGNVTATFGQDRWDLMPFARMKSKYFFDFSEFNDSPSLQVEIKLIAYGMLFNKSPQGRRALTFHGVNSQVSHLKSVYRFLHIREFQSLSHLSDARIWSQFEEYLFSRGYAKSSLEKLFVSINAVIKLEPWHQLKLDIELIKSKVLAHKLSDKDSQQILVIPERLSNAIYGKAIELVDKALPHQALIAEVEARLQENYLEGSFIVDAKIERGTINACLNTKNDNIIGQKYSVAVKDNQPYHPSDIIAPLKGKIDGIRLDNGVDFRSYLGQLITACYIICGGFSGMRKSELDKLTPTSYYKDTFEGRDYHMLQSHTFKLGEKRETWVTAPIAKQAIELASTLTKNWRSKAEYPDDKYTNTLWVNQSYRSHTPKIITTWSERLTRFCEQFNFVVTEEDYQESLDCNPRSIERVKAQVIVGQPWYMTPHQFRRSLAFYCIKNRLGTLVALKQQFKHLYLAMTEWYTNGGKLASLRDLKVDEKIQHTLNEINSETTANIIFKLWHSDGRLSGSHGKAIIKMRGDVPHIYSSWEIIYKAVTEGRLTLHGTAHSYCKSGYDCDMDGVVTPQFCVDCRSGSSIIDEKQAKWWQKKHQSLVSYMELCEDISVTEKSHFITQIRAAENVMTDFNMPFTPFEPELKITEL
jgi:hypothetical protein